MALNPTDVAIRLARETGVKFEDSDVDREKSKFYPDNSFILFNKTGIRIAKFEASIIRKRVKEPSVPPVAEPVASQEARAIAWARSMGYPVPTKPDGCLVVFLVVLGLCIWIIPGVAVIFWVVWKKNQYKTAVEAIVVRWLQAGKPDPGIRENLEPRQSTIAESIEDKLDKLSVMKSKGLVSEEEFEVLRKRALGLDT